MHAKFMSRHRTLQYSRNQGMWGQKGEGEGWGGGVLRKLDDNARNPDCHLSGMLYRTLFQMCWGDREKRGTWICTTACMPNSKPPRELQDVQKPQIAASTEAAADPLLEFDRELYALVQLVQASSSICETAHVEHQDLRQPQQLDFLLRCHWSTVICCLVVCKTYS